MCHLFSKFYGVLLILYIWIYLIAREVDGASEETGKKPGCSVYEFKCKSDESCVDTALLCDGLKDCSDGSDETEEECSRDRKCMHSITNFCFESRADCLKQALETCGQGSCKEDEFRCTYGACIRSSAKCDGSTDCADNSDETNADCPPISNDITSTVHCNTSQFQCISSRKCIDSELLCNGKGDCDDNSDETLEQCENTNCTSSEFRCDYGACINASGVCDGKTDCFDGSDEFEKTCYKKYSITQRVPYFPPNACFLPRINARKNLNMKINCPYEKPACANWKKGQVSLKTVMEYRCKNGYGLLSGQNNSVVLCWGSQWRPDFNICQRTCKALKPENVDLTCSYEGKIVDCKQNKVEGTSVRPRCKTHYRAPEPVHYRQIHCESNGKWTDELFKCVPECGRPVTSKHVKPLIANASVEEFGEAPWHVAVYYVKDSKNRQLICGGTLISPYLVVSAAHCFFQPSIQKLNNASDYEIAVSKYSRQYSKQDNRYTKKYKIREIILPKSIYTGHSTRYASDIVILWIKEAISLNPAVMPACVPWSEDTQFNPGEGSLGLASGFGRTESGKESKSRRIVQLPFIGRNKCIKSLHEDFKDIVTLDKFCAGSQKGPGVREGDSGGGLLFRNPDLGVYYIQGIVSVKDDSDSSVAVFTSINSYLDWMEEVRIRVQRSIDKRAR